MIDHLAGGPPPAGLSSDEAKSAAVHLSRRTVNKIELELKGGCRVYGVGGKVQ